MRQTFNRILRGPAASRILARCGIEPRRFWLLVDLFNDVSERQEMMDQLGRNGIALKLAAWIYFAMSTMFALGMLLSKPAPLVFSTAFQLLSAFLLLTVLLSETGNSLVNPMEGLILAHQPINGATYTAAKLTHLLRIVVYLVPGLNLAPALGLLILKGARWYFPVLHLLFALAAGLTAGLSCCAVYGLLIRFVPVKRLKATAQLAGIVPLLAVMWWQSVREYLIRLHIVRWLPDSPPVRWCLGAAIAIAILAAAALGIRSLSADYLVRVSAIARAGSSAGAKARKSRMAALVARFSGGQGARAGYAYVSRMMLRDWQFRRQLAPMAPALLMPFIFMAKGLKIDAFSGKFTVMHLLPHIFGLFLFTICTIMPNGNDYKGTWIFLLTPTGVFGRFARGVHALLWTHAVILPHVVVLLLLSWYWGVWHAVLFTLYSLAAASIYLALCLRLVDGVPFGRQLDTSRGITLLPIMLGGALAIGVAVGVQYLIFQSPLLVVALLAALGPAAYYLTRSSLRAFDEAMRHSLTQVSGDGATLYKEIVA